MLCNVELNLRHNYIGPHGLAELAKLVLDGNLDTLDVAGFNNVGDEGIKSIPGALQSKKCKLQTSHIPGNGITVVGAEHVSDALKNKECQLTKLDLSGNQLTDEGVEHLRDALKSEQCQPWRKSAD